MELNKSRNLIETVERKTNLLLYVELFWEIRKQECLPFISCFGNEYIVRITKVIRSLRTWVTNIIKLHNKGNPHARYVQAF